MVNTLQVDGLARIKGMEAEQKKTRIVRFFGTKNAIVLEGYGFNKFSLQQK